MTSGLFAVIAILGALECRRRDGLGCHIDLGIADVAMPLQLFQLAALDQTVPQPETTYLNGGAAYYRVYATRDGRHITLGAVEPKFWRAFCDAAGRPDWIARQQEPLPQSCTDPGPGGVFRDAVDCPSARHASMPATAASVRCSIWPRRSRRRTTRRAA